MLNILTNKFEVFCILSVIQNLSIVEQMNYHELYHRCTVLAIVVRYEKLKVKQWDNTEEENMPCTSRFLFQHLSASPSSKLVWAQRETLGKVPKISVPRQMIESREERECTMSLNPSLCPKAGLFISDSTTPASYLSNLFLEKWHQPFSPFLRQALLGTGQHIPRFQDLPFMAIVLGKCRVHPDSLWLVAINFMR